MQGLMHGVSLPQETSYKRMLEAGYHLLTRQKITSLHAVFTLANLLYGLPEAVPSRTGIRAAVFFGYMVNVRVSCIIVFNH